MSGFPLFFQKPVVLSSEVHRNFKFRAESNYKFALKANSIPLTLAEFERAAACYPIVFTKSDNPVPVVVTGLTAQQNVFVEPDGSWANGKYVPAYVRKFPFLFLESSDGDQFTLCVEEANLVENIGSPLFEDGKPTSLVSSALDFCKNYHAAWQQTVEQCVLLKEHGLLIDRRADIQTADGEKFSLDGFNVIDREKFYELTDDVMLKLPRSLVGAINSHFVSMSSWQNLLSRIVKSDDPARKKRK